jgi:hypothetical protein
MKQKLTTLFVLLAILLALAPIQPAHAFGILYAKPVASGAADCSSWANACTLQTALTNAPRDAEIWVAMGTHRPTTSTLDRVATFQLKDSVAVYGGFKGTETARDQRDPAASVTVLSGDIDRNDSQTPSITDIATVTGNGTNSYHVVTGVTGATLDGVTITAGFAGGTSTNTSGGGIYNLNNSPTLANIVFMGNAANDSGGGMYNNYSSPSLMNVTFSGNAAGHSGGGMKNYHGNPTLMNIVFSGNTSDWGGGMRNDYCNLTLTNVTFSSNAAASDGGGMYNYSSSPTLVNVTFNANTAVYGGGMDNWENSNPTLTNVTFSANTVTNAGGGISNVTSSPTLTNVTFSGNSADSAGGGMSNTDSSNPQIRNTIFWGNTAVNAGAQIYNSSSTPVVSDSVVQDGCPAGSTCTNIITGDPLLGALGNYGGFTQTIPLLTGSSAIDKGYDVICTATDQRGIERPQGIYCDIGAYEYEQAPSVKSIVRASASPTYLASVDFTVTFTESVTDVDMGDFTPVVSGLTGASVTGLSGGPKIYTVTVNTGTGDGTLRLDVVPGGGIVDMDINPLTGLPYTSGETYTVIEAESITFRSVGANDGYILESTETSSVGGAMNSTSTVFYLGDGAADKQYRAILHFDLNLPANAVITSVTLKLKKQGLVGSDPFPTLGKIAVDIRTGAFGNNNILQLTDFQSAAHKNTAGMIYNTPVNNWYSVAFPSSAFSFINKRGVTQFRLRFQIDDNENGTADYLKFYSGDFATAAARPTLVIEYYIP